MYVNNGVEIFNDLANKEISSMSDYVNYEMQHLQQSTVSSVRYSISTYYISRMQAVMCFENALMTGRDAVNSAFWELTRIYNDAMERLVNVPFIY